MYKPKCYLLLAEFSPGDTPTRNVRSFGVFWVRREWSGEEEKEREGERGKADGREERTTGGGSGRSITPRKFR